MRDLPKPEDVFLSSIKKLITNLLIENPNYRSDYYYKEGMGVRKLIEDTKERASYILEKIQDTEHLVTLTEEEKV